MRALHLYKIAAILCLGFNVAVHWFNIQFFSYSLFPYIHGDMFNMLFSAALIPILVLVNARNFRFFPWFNVLIFIDTIMVYRNIQNFLFHVFILVVLTQIYYRISVLQIREKKIADHLIENE